MGQIGTIKIDTPNGPQEIPVFETSNVSYPVVRVQTPSGVGALHLVDPANAQIPYVRFDTAAGVKAIGTSITNIIDDFEDNNLSEYSYVVGCSTTVNSFRGSYAWEDTQDGIEAASYSMSGLPNYPSQGDHWEFMLEPWYYDQTSGHSASWVEFVFGLQEDPGRNMPKNGYGCRFYYDTFHFHKYVNGSQSVIADYSLSHHMDSTNWQKLAWEWSTNGDIKTIIHSSSGVVRDEFTVNDTAYTSGGLGYWTSDRFTGSKIDEGKITNYSS